MRKCTECGMEWEDDQRFCGKCGAKLPASQKAKGGAVFIEDKNTDSFDDDEASSAFVAPFPKSKNLHDKGGIVNKLVCSCGSTDFAMNFCYFVGCSADMKYMENERISFNYRCAKCGAEVYLSHESDGDFFCFVPKEKLSKARKLAGVHDDGSVFTKSFCYMGRWDDLLLMPNFTDTYAYLRATLQKPEYVQFYLEKEALEIANVRIISKMLESMEDARENIDDDDDGAGDYLAKAKSEELYVFRFGPSISFAIDDAGKIILNDVPHFVPDKEQISEYDFTKSERWKQVLEAYAAVNDEADKYVGTLSRAVNDSTAKEMISSFELSGSKWSLCNLIAYANYKVLGGQRILIYRDALWIQTKPIIGKATEKCIRINGKIDKMSYNEEENYICFGDEIISFRGPATKTIAKLFKALKLHLDYRKWFLENR